jgi:large subunit ribosomal protein L13
VHPIRASQCRKRLEKSVLTTFSPSHPTILTTLQTRLAYARSWHAVDLATSQLTLGRVASRIAITLMGKHKPIYDPSTDCGDYVVATNCAQLKTTGRKMEQKLYYTHTTRPGSLKSMSMEKLMEKWGGAEVLRRAVRGMLPKNRLRDVRLRRLRGSWLSLLLLYTTLT